MEKEKIMKETIIMPMVVAVAVARAVLAEEDAEGAEEAGEADEVVAKEAARIVSIWKELNVSIVEKRSLFYRLLGTKKNLNMVSKAAFKNLFQSSLKDILTKKEKQTKKKENMEVDDESLDMNVFEKLMEGKHKEFVSNDYYDSTSINSTNTFTLDRII
jgi:hypothetical protein